MTAAHKAAIAIALICAGMLIAWMGYPWTKSQCYRWAAERHGETAVLTAVGMCAASFGKLIPR